MIDWINKHIELVYGIVGGIVSTMIGCYLFIKGKFSDIESIKMDVEKIQQIQADYGKRIRDTEDEQLTMKAELKRLEKIEKTSTNNSIVLAKIAGKLGIEDK